MKTVLIVLLCWLGYLANAQCDFPKEYEGAKVRGIYAHQGQLYMYIKEVGYRELVDTAGKYKIVAYDQIGNESYATLACGEKILVSTVLPGANPIEDKPLTATGTRLRKGGVFMVTGSTLMLTGFTAYIAVVASGGGSKAGLYLPPTLAALGSGMMIIGSVNLIKGGNGFRSQRSELRLNYHGSGGGLQWRF